MSPTLTSYVAKGAKPLLQTNNFSSTSVGQSVVDRLLPDENSAGQPIMDLTPWSAFANQACSSNIKDTAIETFELYRKQVLEKQEKVTLLNIIDKISLRILAEAA